MGLENRSAKEVVGEKLEEDEIAGKVSKCTEPASGVFFPFKSAKT